MKEQCCEELKMLKKGGRAGLKNHLPLDIIESFKPNLYY